MEAATNQPTGPFEKIIPISDTEMVLRVAGLLCIPVSVEKAEEIADVIKLEMDERLGTKGEDN